MRTSKTEWSAILICEIVFGFIGTIFTVVGAILWTFIDEIAASPNSHGNVHILPWIFGGIGILFLLIFAILAFVMMKQIQNRKRLIEQGSFINACVTEIRQDLFVKINRRHPYYVICEGTNPYTGEKLTFRSASVMENPSHLAGRYLRVFIDLNNPKNYLVEINRNYDV